MLGGEGMLDTSDGTDVREIWTSLGLPGIVDVHTHFMPKRVLDKVWAYFDSAGPLVGRTWPIRIPGRETERVEMLRQFGVRRFTSLVYPHRPDMAAWLNEWAVSSPSRNPDCVSTATFYPEQSAPRLCGGGDTRRGHESSRHISKSVTTIRTIRPSTTYGRDRWTPAYQS